MNIANLLRRAAAEHAGQVALRMEDEEIGYGHFAETAGRFAAYLHAVALAPGDRVGFYLPNCLEYLTGLLGVWQAGGVGVPLNHMFPEAALRHAITDSGLTHLVVLPGDVALIMYTSGSTGVPKGVRQTHRNITAQVDGVIDLYELTAADHVLNCMPLFHVGGLQLGSLPVLLRGGQITFMAKWDPLVWIDLAQRLRPTYGGLIATMMIDVGNRTVGSPVVLDSFRLDTFQMGVDRIDDMIITGGENIFPQMVEEHLADCPDLAEVAVIGTAHERWVEQVTAVVVPNRGGVTVEDVAAWCAGDPNLRGMHRPRRIEIVDALPRTGSGKLDRPALRRMFR